MLFGTGRRGKADAQPDRAEHDDACEAAGGVLVAGGDAADARPIVDEAVDTPAGDVGVAMGWRWTGHRNSALRLAGLPAWHGGRPRPGGWRQRRNGGRRVGRGIAASILLRFSGNGGTVGRQAPEWRRGRWCVVGAWPRARRARHQDPDHDSPLHRTEMTSTPGRRRHCLCYLSRLEQHGPPGMSCMGVLGGAIGADRHRRSCAATRRAARWERRGRTVGETGALTSRTGGSGQ
jgi:hypothetical protein